MNLYDKYYVINDKNKTQGFINDLACEGCDRIKQLDYLIQKVKELESEAIEISERSKKEFRRWVEYIKANNLDFETTPTPSNINMSQEEYNNYSNLSYELELHTEHFYYIAFRLRGIIKYLPGLKKFESEGIRNVRNKLIEHPDKDKDSQVFIRSFAFGNIEIGPVIKALRYNDQTDVFPDKGLYVNASELRTNLEEVLNQFLSNQSIL